MSDGCAFEEEDFASSDGMMTAVWGPALWMSMHTISFNYPVQPREQDKRTYARWLCSTGKVLPCGYCRRNFEKNLRAAGFFEKSPSPFENRESFSRLVWRLHDEVNKMLGKPPSPSYEEVRQQYESFRSRCLTKAEEVASSEKAAGPRTDAPYLSLRVSSRSA